LVVPGGPDKGCFFPSLHVGPASIFPGIHLSSFYINIFTSYFPSISFPYLFLPVLIKHTVFSCLLLWSISLRPPPPQAVVPKSSHWLPYSVCPHPNPPLPPLPNGPAKFLTCSTCFYTSTHIFACGLLIALMMAAASNSETCQFLPDYTANHPRRQTSSYTPP
jgi:hypothetical protein